MQSDFRIRTTCLERQVSAIAVQKRVRPLTVIVQALAVN